MRDRPLGRSGIRVSVVGLGCNNFGWRIDEDASRAVVDAALDAGITFFDTAESYGDGDSERFLGAALRGRRDEVVIATKFGWSRGPGDEEIARGSRDYIRGAIERSLKRLGTDYVDLYQYHRPDGRTPIEETLATLDGLVSEGLVRAIGCSNFEPERLGDAERVASERGLARFESVQNNYSLLEREAEHGLVQLCEELEVGLIPYFPLARGLLTGKYRRDEPAPQGARLSGDLDVPEETWDRVDALHRYAERQGATLLDIAIGGLLAQRAVSSVIAGATKPEQVRANAAAGAWQPDEAAYRELLEL